MVFFPYPVGTGLDVAFVRRTRRAGSMDLIVAKRRCGYTWQAVVRCAETGECQRWCVCTPITADMSLALGSWDDYRSGLDCARGERHVWWCWPASASASSTATATATKNDSTVMMTTTARAIPQGINLPKQPISSRPVSDVDPIFPDKSNIRHLSTWADYS